MTNNDRRTCAKTSRSILAYFFIVAVLTIAMVPTTIAQLNISKDAPVTSYHPGHQKMLTLLEQIVEQTSHKHNYIGDGWARQLREDLVALPAETSPDKRWWLYMRLGEAELRLGNETEAIETFVQASHLLAGVAQEMVPKEIINETYFRLGVAYMRLGETQNCCLRHTPESCILPLDGAAIHTQQGGSRQAISQFTKILQNSTRQDRIHFASIWLLNIAHMTLGSYPESIPKPYLIPPSAFESTEQIPHFTNIASNVGLDLFDMCGGAIADDFDNDGYLDLVVSTWDTAGQIRFFRNNQDGTFSEQTAKAGLLGLYGGLNLIQSDYNNDGYTDVFVLRGAWLKQNGNHPNSLLRNNGDGTFTDVTFDAGLGEVHYPTQTASWGDYDNDGDLDLYIGNESTDGVDAPCQLFQNNGDGTFIDVAASAGVENNGFTKAVIWGDYNGDRRPDLYVSNYRGINRLYHNNGDGTFTDVAEKLNVEGPMHSFPAWFWDFDNDGALDLYVAAYAAGIDSLAASMLDMPPRTELARLYRGNGRNGFEEVATQYNLVRPTAPMGSNFGDLDNDGYLDFYLGTGYPDYKDIMPSVMFLNRGERGFVDVSYAGGFAHLQKGHGIVFADLDNDGDQDIFEQMGGAFPGDKYNNVLYENPGFGNHFITTKLVGTHSNRSAIGARIHIEILENEKRRSIYKYINSGGSFGANPLRQTIGLGNATKIETLSVFWPTTDRIQTFHDVPVDQFIQITEGEHTYKFLKLKQLQLGTALLNK